MGGIYMGNLSRWEDEQIFGWWGGLWGLPHPPSGENPVLKRPGNPVIRKI